MAGAGSFTGGVATGAAWRRLAAAALDGSEIGRARRLAGLAVLARVLNAGLGFVTQVLLARWMGETQFGIYAYLYVWLLVAGGIGSLGIPVAALKLIPDYGHAGDLAGLRGFLRDARTLIVLPSIVLAGLAAAMLWVLPGLEAPAYRGATFLALLILPIYVLTDIQTGIARAYDDATLGLAADYLIRPLLLLLLAGCLVVSGLPTDAAEVMAATLAAMALTAGLQAALLSRLLRRRVAAGPMRREPARWAVLAWPLLTVTGFTLLLGSVDILVLKLFVGPEEIALYFAATKIVAITSFVAYGVSATSAHRFAAALASGNRTALVRLAAETTTWTFWPTLAVAVALSILAGPLLHLFGPTFAQGAPIVAVLCAGLVAGAAIGPAERALAMAGHGRVVAGLYAAALAANVGLALAAIPVFGLLGAAAATTLATIVKSALLHAIVRRRLGISMLVGATAPAAALRHADSIATEIVDAAGAARLLTEWRDLAARAEQPNAFYDPDWAMAALRHLPEARGARVVLAWRENDDGRQLVGALPLVQARGRHINLPGTARAGAYYGTLSTPLVSDERPEETWRALLDGARAAGHAALVLPFHSEEEPLARALAAAAAAGGLPLVRLDGHRRALLRSPLGGAAYLRATLESRRRKEADRQRRRLSEAGELAFRISTGAEVGAALERFLALEAAGWKGRAGTALVQARGAATFIRDAAGSLGARGNLRIAELTLDGATIAAGLVLVSGRRAFYAKTAYDEAHARSSPGFLLTLDLTEALLDDPTIDEADSIAVADHPMIDRIWTERLGVARIVVATRRGGGLRFRAAVLVEIWRERLAEAVKARHAKWRASRLPSAKHETKKAPSPQSA